MLQQVLVNNEHSDQAYPKVQQQWIQGNRDGVIG